MAIHPSQNPEHNEDSQEKDSGFLSNLATTNAHVRAGLLALAIGTSLPALAQEQQPIQVAQAQTGSKTDAVRTASLGGSTFDEVMAKDGGYAGIVKEFLGTSDPQIIAFIKREGDRYIASLPQDQRKKGIEKLDAELSSLLSKAKGSRPPQSTVDFFVANAKQLLVEFARYPNQYPNLAELGRGEEAQRRGDEAQRRGEEAQRRGEIEQEKAERLRRIANGTRG